MALTARFLADFTDFYSAVAEATKDLQGLQKTAADSGLALNKMVESLSGERTIKNAMSLAAAVEALGGTSKLTAAELERVGRTASEAVEKATALGVEVPPQLQRLADTTQETSTAFDKCLGSLTKFAAGFFTLNMAWKLVKSGFDMVSDFLVASVTAAAKSSAAYSEEITKLTKSWTDFQVAVGKTITMNQTVIEALNGVSAALGGTSGEFSTNRDVMMLVSDAVVLTVRAMGSLIGALGEMLGPIRSTIQEFRVLVIALLKANELTARMATTLAPYSDAMADLEYRTAKDRAELESWLKSLNSASDGTKKAEEAAARLAAQAAALATKLEAYRGQTVAATGATDDAAEAARLAAEAAARLARQQAAAAEAARLAAQAQKAFEQSIRELEGTMRGTIAGIEKMPPALEDTTAWLELAGPPAGGLAVQLRTVKGAVEELPPALAHLAPSLQGAAAEVMSFGETVSTYLSKDFGKNVVSALAGGGSVAKTAMAGLGNALVGPNSSLAKSLTSGIGKVFGESGMMGQIGKSLNSFVPMIGPMLGPAIEKVTELFTAVFTGGEEATKVSPLRDEFFKLQGGIETLNPRVEQLTGNLSMVQAVFDADTVEEYNAAIGELNTLFAQEQQALGLVTETAKKYGLTLEELGPAFARQELDKKAQELYRDYQVLIAAGVKNTTVTKKMADEVNKYVQQAMKMGVAVPSAMRPMLEQMAKMGVLTDSSGKKIKDVEKSGIKFALTMSEGFEKLIDSVQQLTQVIAGSLGVQLEKTKDRVNAIPDRINIKVNYDEGDRPKALKGGTTTVKGYQGGTKGFEDFGAGTLVMLHGREAVVPQSAVRSPGHGTAIGAPGVTIVINAQGSFFDTPGDLQRLASKVNEALTARHGFTNRSKAA